MKAKKPTEKTTRKRYSDEFKDQALKRAERDGVAMVAQDLGIAETQIYAWRRKRQIEGAVTETERLKEAEVARLKRDLARLEEENIFLKKASAYGERDNRSEVRPDPTPRRPACDCAHVRPAVGLPQRLLRVAGPSHPAPHKGRRASCRPYGASIMTTRDAPARRGSPGRCVTRGGGSARTVWPA